MELISLRAVLKSTNDERLIEPVGIQRRCVALWVDSRPLPACSLRPAQDSKTTLAHHHSIHSCIISCTQSRPFKSRAQKWLLYASTCSCVFVPCFPMNRLPQHCDSATGGRNRPVPRPVVSRCPQFRGKDFHQVPSHVAREHKILQATWGNSWEAPSQKCI